MKQQRADGRRRVRGEEGSEMRVKGVGDVEREEKTVEVGY